MSLKKILKIELILFCVKQLRMLSILSPLEVFKLKISSGMSSLFYLIYLEKWNRGAICCHQNNINPNQVERKVDFDLSDTNQAQMRSFNASQFQKMDFLDQPHFGLGTMLALCNYSAWDERPAPAASKTADKLPPGQQLPINKLFVFSYFTRLLLVYSLWKNGVETICNRWWYSAYGKAKG